MKIVATKSLEVIGKKGERVNVFFIALFVDELFPKAKILLFFFASSFPA
jgi:hypothetical protein